MKFKKRDKGKNLKRWLLIIIAVAVIVPFVYVCFTKLEGKPPVVELTFASEIVPSEFKIRGHVEDSENGIRQLRVSVLQNGKDIVLQDETFSSAGLTGEGTVRHSPISLDINARKQGFSDGPATLKILASDYSWRNWWKGNQAYLEKEIMFDTRPPAISVLSSQHNVTPGGSGLVIYKLSEPCPESGVSVGDDFFSGYSGYFTEKDIYLAFFAVPVDYEKKDNMLVKAVDPAGNEATSGFYHYVRGKSFVTDTINISENFLTMKLPEFYSVDGFPADASPADQFVFINTELRAQNNETILANGKHTKNKIFWNDAFGRMPNSARRANFGDRRIYKFQDEVISHAIHMGIDLASVKHAPVPSANRGRIAFTGYVGIYGNLVCVDHGCGLMSIYAHLSSVSAKAGDSVEKGDVIGYTGITGLAGGDHLHYGMFVGHMFVNPVEWWDASWINNNITTKIASVQAMTP